MRIIRYIVKYIFIIYLFDMLDANIFLYKFGPTKLDYFDLGQSTMPYISGRRKYIDL